MEQQGHDRGVVTTIEELAAAFPGHVQIKRPLRSRPFIDRVHELASLNDAWTSGRSELVIAHGRRRVGKSRLLAHFAAPLPIAYYVAARQLEADQLRDLGVALGPLSTGFRRGRPPRLAFAGWEELLDALSEAATHRRVGLILDEFPYLVDANASLPSLIQRWWDRTGSRSDVVLVLAGSEQEMMRRLLDRDGALHGRPTRRLEIEPLDYFQAGKFVRGWEPVDRIRMFAITGGVPAYLEQFDDRNPLRYEIYHHAFSPDGRLFQEGPELLSREFTEPRTYESIVRAIAQGSVAPGEIAKRAGLESANRVAPYLDRLIGLGLVQRRVLPLDHVAPRPRTSQYVLADPYLRFYFALVDPWRSAIQRGQGEAVLDEIWGEAFDHHVSRTFEEVARQYLMRLSGARRIAPLANVGYWWFDGGDIDAAGVAGSHLVVAGEAKWTNEFLKPADLAELQQNVAAVAPADRPELFLFSRNGFDRNVPKADARQVRLRDLYRSDLDYEALSRRPAARR